ncbi:glycosyltransferase family 32 protein [Caenimonas sp. SL110]|uniref:glycosyltransferase family 32 protein n=1 Tax=Caenimonas sp. SL110 TaxID=1450524 RepID=UPI000652D3F3|nr:glycosyltransferase [Caenimonas sp. SL110]
MIPRILHQTHSTARLPAAIASGVRDLQRSNPGWDYRFYDDAAVGAFIRKQCPPEIRTAFFRINPDYGPARADLFRYALMYLQGGVYLDVKSSAMRPLDQVVLPGDRFVLSQWPNRRSQAYAGYGLHPELKQLARGEFQQWHIIAQPGHPYLRAVIRSVLRNIDKYDALRDGVGRNGVWRMTGPIAYSLAIASQFNPARHRFVPTHQELGLIYSTVDSQGKGSHQQLLAQRHYTTLVEPLVMQQQ